MYAEPGEVLHFSEDPTITRFRPHVAATAQQPDAYVWAVDAARCPDYWFPRQCPRVMAWVNERSTPQDAARLIGPGARRVHVVEYAWLPAILETKLVAYRFAAQDFRPVGEDRHAMVSDHEVTPLGPPEPVGDLLAAHERAGIELRLTGDLWPWWDQVTTSTLGFSGIRLRNAAPRPA
ncbi:hypothetical protein HJ588_15395 [Flexivirga sp. ID2601S]|uniref:Uncharacterized protein n=1 Tax=Flexivirga aerilata TaxID=1656889 RepID=A0A849AQT8_9MICO|nr:DUF6886 family protein [Flexivirga aerilata]NNG40650.1 hypothetical protein [Flexivirga aerilata]